MSGFQLSGFTYWRPKMITASTIVIFVITMTLLTVADSLIPTTSTYDITPTMKIAGRLTYAPVGNQPACTHPVTLAANSPAVQKSNGACVSLAGTWMPRKSSRLRKCPDHPTPTVAAPMAYSSTRSHPMIQATNSPIVAYE